MTTSRKSPDSAALEKAAEKTVASSEFTVEGLCREAVHDIVRNDSVTGLGRFLQKTTCDTIPVNTATDVEITTFSSTRELPADILPSGSPRFQILEELGHGGGGRIYALADRCLGRTIAVRFLQKSRESNPRVRAAFINEARVTAMLEHPNIMPIYDIGVTERESCFLL